MPESLQSTKLRVNLEINPCKGISLNFDNNKYFFLT